MSSRKMNAFSLPVFILMGLTTVASGAMAREEKSHSLRHSEQAQTEMQEGIVGSMGDLLQSEAEVMDPKSPKAALQRQLVALIWLERVLEENLQQMDEEEYRKKVAKSKTGLEKDSTPATADMLGKMRTEMHEYSVPFFRDAVKNELADLRARQKVLLDKIIAIDAGEPVEDLSDSPPKKEDDKKKSDEDDDVVEKKKKRDAAKKQKDDEDKKNRDRQGNIGVFLMSLIGATLVLIVLGIAIKVHTHIPRNP